MQQNIVLHASIISLGRILLMKFRLMDCEQKIDALQSEIDGLKKGSPNSETCLNTTPTTPQWSYAIFWVLWNWKRNTRNLEILTTSPTLRLTHLQ